MQDTSNFFSSFEQQGVKIDEKQKKQILEKINSVLSYEPLLGIFGKTGVGKSNLCDALFGKKICPTTDVTVRTRDTKGVLLKLGKKGIRLIDFPGGGKTYFVDTNTLNPEKKIRLIDGPDDEKTDEERIKQYLELLPKLDLVLWLLKGGDNNYCSDEVLFKKILKPYLDPRKPLLFVISQADAISPCREWNEKNHEPGPRQQEKIENKINMISLYFDVPTSKIIPVSAHEKYNLVKLVYEMIFALPLEKQY